MPKPLVLALDKSVRRKDVDGRLYIESSPISKAMICPYLGSEIPDHDRLGLTPDKIYYLFRDPVELAKAADSFRGLPILYVHKPTKADDHPKELTVGAVGTDVAFNSPYLEAPLCIWTEEAIAGIETGVQREISSGYRYTPDMTPGEYEGEKYDGVMRAIVGNHIALVDVGRAGPDVIVQDANPFPTSEIPPMNKKRIALLTQSLIASIGPMLAQDAAIDPVKAKELATKLSQAMDEDPEMKEKKVAEDEDDETDEEKKAREAKAGAKDEFPSKDDDKKDDKPAMDAATVDAKIAAAVKAANDASSALYAARSLVRPICGEVALDSADKVLAFALKQLGVDTAGVHPSAFTAMIGMAQDRKTAAPKIAQDAAGIKSTVDLIPGLKRFA